MTVAPNFAYDLCARQIKEEDCVGLDLGGWTVAGCAAEPIRMETLNAFADRFARYGFRRDALCPFYGLAEATLMVSGGPVGLGQTAVEVSTAALKANRVVPPADGCESCSVPSCGQPSPEHPGG
jgi:acyl-CoA synthetase (AMP-forming)/AMP-acid ligase II